MFQGRSLKEFTHDLRGEIKQDNVSNGAAALAYYLMLSIFPGMIALLTLIPYLPIPNLETAVMDFLRQSLPGEAAELFAGTVESVVSERRGGLLTFGLLLAIWSASNGMFAVMRQLNVTYGVEEGRPFLKARGTALLLTALFGVVIIGAFALIVFGGMAEDWLGNRFDWGAGLQIFFATLRWAIIALALLFGFAVIYYFGPNVDQEFRFITPGSIIGVLLLAATALGFRYYVTNFANYSAVYGSLGAVIILLFSLYLLGWIILLGSEINSLVEHYSQNGKVKGEKTSKGKGRQGKKLHPATT